MSRQNSSPNEELPVKIIRESRSSSKLAKRSPNNYFNSKLFRGSSETRVPGRLHILRDLNAVKVDSNFHNFSYSQISQVISTKAKPSNFQKAKQRILKKYSQITLPKETFVSLHPNFLKDKLPKTKERHALPSEQRKILIDHFIAQAERAKTSKAANSLGNIWHQTLSDPLIQESYSLRSSIVISKRASIGEVKEPPPKNKELNQNIETNQKQKNEEENRNEVTSEKVNKLLLKGPENETPYNVVTKQMEFFANLLRDFHKIISNTQKSYQKAVVEQVHLCNFVSTFIKEVDEIEKAPKSGNISRLRVCITSLETKVNELNNEKDLVHEQLERIYYLLGEKGPNEKLSMLTPVGLSPIPRSAIGSLEITQVPKSNLPSFFGGSTHPRNSLQVPDQSDLSPTGKLDGTPFSNQDYTLERLSSKTEILKSDVEKLKKERLKYQKSLRGRKPKNLQPSSNDQSPERFLNLPTEEMQNNFNEQPSGLSYKLQRDLSPSEYVNPTHMTLLQFNEPTPKGKDQEINFGLGETEENEPLDCSYHMLIKEETIQEDSENGKEEMTSATTLYQLYESVLRKVEEKIMKMLGETKLFQKDVDEVYTSNSKLLASKINSCFENLINEFQIFSREFEKKGRKFLEDIALNYERFLGLSSANKLKLTSVKNTLVTSIQKFLKLEKFCSKFTQYELTDKILRQKYEIKYKNLKEDLQNDRKTLMFLADQFERSISTYQVDPIENLDVKEVGKLVEKSKSLLRAFYNLEKVPVTEDDFNEKSTIAYKACRSAWDLISVLKEFNIGNENIPAEKYKEAEIHIRTLENLNMRITALHNEITMISKLEVFKEVTAKPLLVLIKLLKKISSIERELRTLLENTKENIIEIYQEIVQKAEGIENEFESHIKRIASSDEHLNFSEWRQNFSLIEKIREEMSTTTSKVKKFAEEKYPLSLTLIPSPPDKLETMLKLKKLCDSLLKTLFTGKMFEEWELEGTFNQLETRNVKTRLEKSFKKILDEISEKEKIMMTIKTEDSGTVKKLVSDVLGVLVQFRFILSKVFELDERVSHEYKEFEEKHLGQEFTVLNPTMLLDRHKERYPKLFSSSSIDVFGGTKREYLNNDHIMIEEHTLTTSSNRHHRLKRQVTLGLIRNLPPLENTEEEYPDKMNSFLEVMKNIFERFFKDVMNLHISQHKFFQNIHEKLQEMKDYEIRMLEEVQIAVYNVQVNHLYYNKEIRPLTQVYKYLNVLNTWSDKVEKLNNVKENMKACLNAVKKVSEDYPLRGGIEIQVVKYQQIQEMVSNSINIIMDLLTLGTKLNEKDLQVFLGHSIRIEEGNLEGYIKVFEKKFKAIYNNYETNSDLIEEDTGNLLGNLKDFIEKLLFILTLSQQKFKNIFRITSEGLRPHRGNFLGYVDSIYSEIKEFADEFCETLNQLSKMVFKPTWLIKTLDNFYKDIVLKDLSVFSRLHKEAQTFSDFKREFENFIVREIKEKSQYRKIHESDPTGCDLQVLKGKELSKSLNDFCTMEEIVCRPELKIIISIKTKETLAMKKTLAIFAVIYSMGHKLNYNIDNLIEKITIEDIHELLSKLDLILEDMINYIFNAIEDARILDRDYYGEAIPVNLEPILKDDILIFYSDCKRSLEQLKDHLYEIVQFDKEVERKFKNQVLLLRDDWVSCVKEKVSKNYVSLDKRIQPIEADYPEFKNKLFAFLKDLQNQLKEKKVTYLETVKKVEFLNEYFLNDWFFNYSEEEKDSADKLYPQIKKFIKNINQRKYKEVGKLGQKIEKLANLIAKCDRNIKGLGEEGAFKKVFVNVKDWHIVEDYYKRVNFGRWKDILDFVQVKMINKEGKNIKEEFTQTIHDLDELYIHLQTELKCNLSQVQIEFLEAVYFVLMEEN